MQNSMVVFTFSVLDWKYPFWANLVQKIKIVSLSWNLRIRLIGICRIQWWCSLFLFTTGNTFFWLFYTRNTLLGYVWLEESKLSVVMMMNCFCGMVDRRKAFSLIFSRDHCQRSSPSRISDTPRTGFEPVQNLSSGLVEWSCAAVITTTPWRHSLSWNLVRLQISVWRIQWWCSLFLS